MNRLDNVAKRLRKSGRRALVAYLTAGYPSFNEQQRLIKILERSGIDVLELGVPFSDPIADGPTIQFSSLESLKKGTSLRKIIKWVSGLRKEVHLPIVLMSYLNPILRYGLKSFAKDAKAAGVDGLIIPDLIAEEAQEIKKALREKGLDLIFLVAPTTPQERQSKIASSTSGFLYAVSVTGVTGARTEWPHETNKWIKTLSRLSPKPVYVGFGISRPEHIRALKGSADGFIVGSAIIDIIRKNSPQRRPLLLERFIKALSEEINHGR